MALIGLAMGSYGLSQALLQVPYGFLSDRFGRKKMLVIGLLILQLVAQWRRCQSQFMA